MPIKNLEDVNTDKKTILMRADLNSEVVDGKVQDGPRIKATADSIKNIIGDNKIVLLAHQGRKGQKGFTNLEQHAKLLSKHLPVDVLFVNDIYGEKALNAIREMENGDVLLLDNVRKLDEETQEKVAKEHAKTDFVQKLSKVCDIYVNDAFSVCHRAHASMMGFTKTLPSCPGPQLNREMENLDMLKEPKHEIVFILGGNKPEDAINIITEEIGFDIDFVLAGGVIGEMFLQAKGIKFGKKDNYLEKFSELKDKFKTELGNYDNEIILPKDVAIDDNGKRKEIPVDDLPAEKDTKDIGKKTIEEFKSYIENANTIVMNGTMGVNEEKDFQKGTYGILKAIEQTEGVSILGGGDTSQAVEDLDVNRTHFSHVSLAGGAFVKYISGEKLPGLEALKKSNISSKEK